MSDNPMGGVGDVFEKHPLLIAGAIGLVALIAYLQSRNSGTATDTREYTFAGGGTAKGIDPEAAAISQSAINAGVANIGTIAQLAGLYDTNRSSLTGELARTSAGRDTSLAETYAGRDSSLAQTEAARTLGLSSISASLRSALFQTEASRDVALAGTAAQRDTSLAATAASRDIAYHGDDAAIAINTARTSYDLEAARLTHAAQIATTAAQERAAKLAADNENFRIQASKDITRAQANAGIVNNVVGTIGDIVSALNPFSWF